MPKKKTELKEVLSQDEFINRLVTDQAFDFEDQLSKKELAAYKKLSFNGRITYILESDVIVDLGGQELTLAEDFIETLFAHIQNLVFNNGDKEEWLKTFAEHSKQHLQKAKPAAGKPAKKVTVKAAKKTKKKKS
jgi:hypothetical protein